MNYEDIEFNQASQTHGQRSCTIDQAEKNAKYAKLGEGKGLSFSFRKNEVVWFPKVEDCFPFFKEFNGTDVMYVGAYSETRKRFVEIPISTFRRIPAGDGEIDGFFDEDVRPLNCELAQMSTDLQRLKRLCEVHTIVCTDLYSAHARVFERDADGKVHVVPDRLRNITLASVKAV